MTQDADKRTAKDRVPEGRGFYGPSQPTGGSRSSQSVDHRRHLRRLMLDALKADTSWCDDFGETTLEETARRTAAICASVLTPQYHDKDGFVQEEPTVYYLPHNGRSKEQ